MLRGKKTKISPVSGAVVLNNRVCYATFYSMTVKDEIAGFNQWGRQGGPQEGRRKRGQIYLGS